MFTSDISQIRVPKMQCAAHYFAGSLIVCQSGETTPKLYIFDLASQNATALATSISTTNVYKQLSFITSTGLILFDDSQHIAYADLSAGTITSLTTQSVSVASSTKQNVIAANPLNSKALCATSTAGKLLTVDATSLPTTPTTGTITPATLSGQTVKTVIVKPGSTTLWLIGTDSGNVYEINFSGTISKTITLPTTPNIGVTPTHKISNLTMSGNDLYVFTDAGWMYHYSYSAGTLIEQILVHEGGSNTTNSGSCVVSEIVNGQFLHAGPTTNLTGSAGQFLCLELVDQVRSMEIDSYFIQIDNNLGPQYAGISSTANVGWIAYPSTSASSGFYYSVILVFRLTGLATTNLPDRAQDPPGTDISCRSILIEYFKPGLWRVEQDQTITSGASSLTAQLAGMDYIEICSEGTVGVNEKLDFRREAS